MRLTNADRTQKSERQFNEAAAALAAEKIQAGAPYCPQHKTSMRPRDTLRRDRSIMVPIGTQCLADFAAAVPRWVRDDPRLHRFGLHGEPRPVRWRWQRQGARLRGLSSEERTRLGSKCQYRTQNKECEFAHNLVCRRVEAFTRQMAQPRVSRRTTPVDSNKLAKKTNEIAGSGVRAASGCGRGRRRRSRGSGCRCRAR